MSLFDEFDRLTPDPDKDKRDARAKGEATGPVPLRDPLASRIPPERKLDPTIARGPIAPPIGAPDPMIRPVESIRFSLSRGAVAAIIAGSVAASALLYAGGYLTAYVVYQPANETTVAQKHPEPPPLVDADRPKPEAGTAAGKEKDSGPLKVVMSPETSGGQAVVAPQSAVPETRPPAAPPAPPVSSAPPAVPSAKAKAPAAPVAPTDPTAPPVAVPTQPVEVAPPPSGPEKLLGAPEAKSAAAPVPLPPAPGGLSVEAPPLPPKITGRGAVTPPPVPGQVSAPPAVKAPAKPAPDATPSSEASKPAQLATAPLSETPAKPAFTGRVGYTVQLGAFSSQANALRMQQNLGGGIPGLRVEKGITPSGRTLFYLRAGYFAKRGEARDLAGQLKAEKRIKAGYVMRVKAPTATP